MNAVQAPDNGAASHTGGVGKFIIVYLCILGLAGLQFLVAYSHLDKSQMFSRMFLIAIAEAGLGIMFFMHLGSEKRNFVVSVAVITLFVLGAMQYSWTDSYRMEMGVPNAQYKTGTVQ